MTIIKEVIRVPVIEEERFKIYEKAHDYNPLRNFELKKQHYINVQIAYGASKRKAQKDADELFGRIFSSAIKRQMGLY